MVQLNQPIPTMGQVADALLSDAPPPTEAVAPTAGVAAKARRSDSRSARLTSSTYNEFTAPGVARVMFTRSFMRRPGVVFTVVEESDNGAPEIVVRQYLKNTAAEGLPAVYAKWTDADADVSPIVGCDAYGYRINAKTPTVPTLTVLTLGNFLFGTLNSIFGTITAALSNQNTTQPIATGTKFTSIAVASSETST